MEKQTIVDSDAISSQFPKETWGSSVAPANSL